MTQVGLKTHEIGRPVLTVSELNHQAKGYLEAKFPDVWVEGEISNFSKPASGHWYFSLKDDKAQLRCTMFRGKNFRVTFAPKDGLKVLVRGQVSLYEERGEYQMRVEHMEESGEGALLRAFEALKQRLHKEGLFDPAKKREIPKWPRRVGVISSPTGAAIQDILSTLARRWPGLPVTVYPVIVQGDEAAPSIVNAMRMAYRRKAEDVFILARGGGSMEDLWAFNDEKLARSIYAFPFPMVSGVGHEVDFTIADFVADRRAPTPTGAAEMVCPDRGEQLVRLHALEGRLHGAMTRAIEERAQRLDGWRERLSNPLRQAVGKDRQALHNLGHRLHSAMGQEQKHQVQRLKAMGGRLRHPGEKLRRLRDLLEHLGKRIERHMLVGLREHRARVARAGGDLQRVAVLRRVERHQERLALLAERLHGAMARRMADNRERLQKRREQMELVGPLRVLERGYAIVTDEHGVVVRSGKAVAEGQRVWARLHEGRLACRVEAEEG